ncbi:tRNA-dependent cyclodipeptide synthase [Streptomyces pinistramenti]|uniref:tRNA-dependent cyclodipeptide synthase n=1 Tax=Streptomyces pinistramenti TaxID=2884812 RepID=UPI001D08F182|nr:tRNA-dependent cyclodipeptide synthase [Streptomyces pinistramenti]MCB5907734.1 tRNA-dependent cyclodipeptide synthase [Streptomyces pinistramenti]
MLFSAEPYTENCARISADAEHALIGLSPFNSYYKTHVIKSLTAWAAATFKRVDVLVPGAEGALTLTASGWTHEHAERRLREARKRLCGPARRALAEAGVENPSEHVHTWSELLERAAYRELREQVGDGCRTDPGLRRRVREMTRRAVDALTPGEPDEQQVNTALGYVLAELPFMVDSPSIFDVKSSVFVYHQQFDLAHSLLNGNEISAVRINPEQGFLVVRPQENH